MARTLLQPSLLDKDLVERAVVSLAETTPEARGAIFTRREVVEFILDLAGYVSNRPLHELRLLEPSFGAGDFLLVAVERLLKAWKSTGCQGDAKTALSGAIRAVELHNDTFAITRKKTIDLLVEESIPTTVATEITDEWTIQGDFLLTPLPVSFDFVVGNPPYVRQELIPSELVAEYRSRYTTVYDRADLYVPFIERSLNVLGPSGTLGFICANRWMKNRYGGPLRQLIANNFRLRTYVDMVGSQAFQTDVLAYPAITIITNDKPGRTRVACRPTIAKKTLNMLAKQLLSKETPKKNSSVKEIARVAVGNKPWILESFDQLELVQRLERDFPKIEEAGCKIGIGVATGADQVFIGPFDKLDVESDRKLPLAMTKDIINGKVEWCGHGIVNPFSDEQELVDLSKYPKLMAYLLEHKDRISKRHVALKNPGNWYRTIDRIHPALAKQPKLLIPDIKGKAHIVYENGHLYPHHNLYYIISHEWPLRTLQAVLLSGIARLFVSAYSTKMRGGFLRFQAQYLRRIRLPRWQDIDPKLKKDLATSTERCDVAARDKAVLRLYGFSHSEWTALSRNHN